MDDETVLSNNLQALHRDAATGAQECGRTRTYHGSATDYGHTCNVPKQRPLSDCSTTVTSFNGKSTSSRRHVTLICSIWPTPTTRARWLMSRTRTISRKGPCNQSRQNASGLKLTSRGEPGQRIRTRSRLWTWTTAPSTPGAQQTCNSHGA